MKNGDKIVWDSGFYFSEGTFIGESSIDDTNYKIRLGEGEIISVKKYEVLPISDLGRIEEKYKVTTQKIIDHIFGE